MTICMSDFTAHPDRFHRYGFALQFEVLKQRSFRRLSARFESSNTLRNSAFLVLEVTWKTQLNKRTESLVRKQKSDGCMILVLVPRLPLLGSPPCAMKNGLCDIPRLATTNQFTLPTRISAEACLALPSHPIAILITLFGYCPRLVRGSRRKSTRFCSKA